MNAINWFEIPVSDIERAVAFYEAILGQPLHQMEVNAGYPMALLPAGEGGIGGALVQGPEYTPATTGVVVYLNGGRDLSDILDRVPAAGGQIIMPKTSLGDHGAAAYFLDSEGNRLGLQSPA